ncbi:16S rRNA (cytosine967-C5)-methyltransferase [Oceanobacillus limi]|uniref:16S rRNA (cytosine(967)-C(5))-methyltransferase n=1 Tax=Oceanobacillus limi TaxID=930131 RepID=A0A1I0HBI8_9BACI|nr:16S rRNA (cytosine(967)-C(5))-methyltransferase RsmB [Oceanobacillus limi]SET81082.1 16S rRNA (cytosine967-C5)-methyltransferase [Oceanobacillus limi]
MEKFLLRNTIIDLLLRIEQDSGYSHLLIDHEIKKRQIAPKDEGLLTEIVYGTINRKYTLDYYIKHFVQQKKKLEPWVNMLLRMSLYQMVYLDKVPDHAIIHEAVEIAKRRGHKGVSSLVNGVLRNVQRNGVPELSAIKDKTERLAIATSHPQWLVNRWVSHYGYETTKEMCEANLTQKAHSVRIQPLRISRQEAMKQLEEQGYEVRPSIFSSQGIIINKGNILKSNLFEEGYLTIQDQSSMLVGEMLHPKPGMHVLDACSAPGGKVTHIAEKMENRGWIDAHDLHAKKIKLIDQKAAELQLTIIDAKKADARNLQEMYQEKSFDRILVDAPCSGLGVIRGKPDIKYNKKESDITNLAKIQLDILDSIAPLLKENGILIYSTCTVDPAENENVVTAFLNEHSEYQIDDSFFRELPEPIKNSTGVTPSGLQLFPQSFKTDGFFLTRFIRMT